MLYLNSDTETDPVMNLRPVSLSDHPLVRELLDHYYRECPGTLFPLLLLYLANTGNLDAGERAREVSYTDDSFRFTGHTLIQFSREDAMQTGSDPAGRRLLERWESNGQTQISVVMPEIPEDGDVRRARELIHRHDDPNKNSIYLSFKFISFWSNISFIFNKGKYSEDFNSLFI